MPRSAFRDRSVQVVALGLAAMASLVVAQRSAAAQSCPSTPLNDNICGQIENSIDGYKDCYRKLYDCSVIPTFTQIAKASHPQADAALKTVLEQAAAKVTGGIQSAFDAIDAVFNAPSGPASCIQGLNDIDAGLEQTFTDERTAPDLDAHRRTYSIDQLASFTNVVLGARQNRAICTGPLLRIRQSLVLLSELKTRHLDYCQVLRDSAQYKDSSKITGLGQWTAIDPQIHFDQYFNFSVGWNSQCASFQLDGAGGGGVRYSPCPTATLEYRQTLSDLDDSLAGWLSDNRGAIVAAATATATTIAVLGGASGPATAGIGTAVALVVGAIISGIEWWSLQNDLDELTDLIDSKERELKNAVQANYITQDEFNQRVEALCSTWRPVVDMRVQTLLGQIDLPKHIAAIDQYFALSDKLHNWYNELFLWATTPNGDQPPYIDSQAKAELLAQRDAFNQRIFAARTAQEVAVQQNELVNVKAQITALTCTGITSPRARRDLQNKLRSGVNAFNSTCATTMVVLAAATQQAVPFVGTAAASDVSCSYQGFRSDIASLEIRAGAGFAADMTVRDTAGTVVAELTGVTSDTPGGATGLAGFACTSKTGASFGTTADTRLTPGSYPLRLADNKFNFSEADAASLRAFIKDADEKERIKVTVCNRQLGTTITIPRTADACGIATPF